MQLAEQGSEDVIVRIGHVTGSSRVFLYDFSSYTIIQLAVVPRTSVVAIKCSRFSLQCLKCSLPPFHHFNTS